MANPVQRRDNPMTAGKADTLSALAEMIDQIAAAGSVADIQRLVSLGARQLIGADGATLVLRDEGTCRYVAEDAIAPLWKGRDFPIEDCVSGWSMLHREPVVIEDVYADPRVPHAAYHLTFVKSLLIVPIRSSDPLGAIGTYWAQRHHASSDEVALLRTLAASAAVRARARTAQAGGRAPPRDRGRPA